MTKEDIKHYIHYSIKEGYISPEDLKGLNFDELEALVKQMEIHD